MTKDEIRNRICELQTILKECEIILNGKDSEFWGILQRIYRAQSESYKQSTFAAAEDEHKSIRNFIGKQEGVDWCISVVETDFIDQAKRAKEELLNLKEQLVEIEEIDKGVDSIIQDPMYQQSGTI